MTTWKTIQLGYDRERVRLFRIQFTIWTLIVLSVGLALGYIWGYTS